MATPEGRYVLAYNGEVYNYRALRDELASASRTFVTHSDTEVVLQAYAAWGREAFDRLNGMFAIAVWDRDEQTLTLARDQFGIKPLHVSRVSEAHGGRGGRGGSWLFSSEIRPILVSGRHDRARTFAWPIEAASCSAHPSRPGGWLTNLHVVALVRWRLAQPRLENLAPWCKG